MSKGRHGKLTFICTSSLRHNDTVICLTQFEGGAQKGSWNYILNWAGLSLLKPPFEECQPQPGVHSNHHIQFCFTTIALFSFLLMSSISSCHVRFAPQPAVASICRPKMVSVSSSPLFTSDKEVISSPTSPIRKLPNVKQYLIEPRSTFSGEIVDYLRLSLPITVELSSRAVWPCRTPLWPCQPPTHWYL